MTKQNARDTKRLEEALRANLRRRKAQTRARQTTGDDPAAPAAPGAESGPSDICADRPSDPAPSSPQSNGETTSRKAPADVLASQSPTDPEASDNEAPHRKD